MKKLLILAPLLVLSVSLILTGCDSASPPSEQTSPHTTVPASAKVPQVGDMAPDFTLVTLAGETVTLSELRGSPVLINFWATWCPPCKFEMPFLQQVHDKWSDEGLVLLAVDIGETRETVEEFMRTEGLSMPVPMDEDQSVARRYNIRYIPTTYLVDKDGIIQSIKIGAFAGVDEIEAYLSDIMP